MLPALPLTADEVSTLEACSLRAPHPRQRRRAQALPAHHRGHSLNQLASFYAVRYATVHAWVKAWRDKGLAGLAEGPRSGRPPKVPEEKKVATWLGTATQQLREWLPRLATECRRIVSISTLRRIARRLGYCWKRCRRSLKAPRDPRAFAAYQQQLHRLHQAEVAVYYADECRFSRQAPVPYAWQRRGQPPVELPAGRGPGGGSVLGFWQAAVGTAPVVAYQRSGRAVSRPTSLPWPWTNLARPCAALPCSYSIRPPSTKPAWCRTTGKGGRTEN